MPIIRKKLAPSDVYPDDIRYNSATDTVQSLINDEWVDNPAADPRTQTSFPPRITADPACDAAQSVTDALEGQITATIEAVGNASTAATIAAIILSLFTFGVFAIFISIALTIANAMLSAGESALNAALTPTVYEALKCILSCHMNSSGRIFPGELGLVQSEVNDQIGGLGATVINSMLSLAGEGGINNLASLGTSTGDCSECGCVEYWCYNFDFLVDEVGFEPDPGAPYGTWIFGEGWAGTAVGGATSINISRSSIPVEHWTRLDIYISPGFDEGTFGVYLVHAGGTAAVTLTHDIGTDHWWADIDINPNKIIINPSSGSANTAYRVYQLTLAGTGDNPFGADNCPP